MTTLAPSFEVIEPPGGPAAPLLVHVPHSSVAIPPEWRRQIVLSDEGLKAELLVMTDHYTDELFGPSGGRQDFPAIRFVNRTSRLVCDPERFEDERREPMEAVGMGAVYRRTSAGRPLREASFSAAEREQLLASAFRPYASALAAVVDRLLAEFGSCLILDCHSFPAHPLAYEDASLDRPDLCLGYQDFHRPSGLVEAFEQRARGRGIRVGHNVPFAGSYVPLRHYQRDPRVTSLMIELNRGLYMDEGSGKRSSGFAGVADFAAGLLDVSLEWSSRGSAQRA